MMGEGTEGAGFQADLLDLFYARVNRRNPRGASGDYARLEDYSTFLLKRLAVRLDGGACEMLNRFHAVQAVMMAMAAEMAYLRGVEDGFRRAANGTPLPFSPRDACHVPPGITSRPVRGSSDPQEGER